MIEQKSDKNQSFEKALARLETLVGEMESGALSLEKMMASFEEGTELVQFCTQKLNEVEKRSRFLPRKAIPWSLSHSSPWKIRHPLPTNPKAPLRSRVSAPKWNWLKTQR